MLRTERQNQIVDLINKKGIATIEELMAEVAASKATIRSMSMTWQMKIVSSRYAAALRQSMHCQMNLLLMQNL